MLNFKIETHIRSTQLGWLFVAELMQLTALNGACVKSTHRTHYSARLLNIPSETTHALKEDYSHFLVNSEINHF